jgi:hypothetical protein
MKIEVLACFCLLNTWNGVFLLKPKIQRFLNDIGLAYLPKITY